MLVAIISNCDDCLQFLQWVNVYLFFWICLVHTWPFSLHFIFVVATFHDSRYGNANASATANVFALSSASDVISNEHYLWSRFQSSLLPTSSELVLVATISDCHIFACDSSIGECVCLFILNALVQRNDHCHLTLNLFFGHSSSLKLLQCQCQRHCQFTSHHVISIWLVMTITFVQSFIHHSRVRVWNLWWWPTSAAVIVCVNLQ